MSAAGAGLSSIVSDRRVAVVGVGNRLRRDDGAGPWIAERLAARGVSRVFDAGPVPENFIGPVIASGAEAVVFVDAAAHGGRPGEVCVAALGALATRAESTHAASLALCGELLEASGIECWLMGVEPEYTGFGEALSPAVEAGARGAEAMLASLLAPAGRSRA